MTHKELVKVAANWAEQRHKIVVTERGAINELPDVFGFDYGYTTLIECKVSRSDFLRDKNKLTRRYDGEFCSGNYRIYCVPSGLFKEDDIPETWGLLEVFPSGLVKLRINIYKYDKKSIWWHEDTVPSLQAEKHLLLNHFLYPRELVK